MFFVSLFLGWAGVHKFIEKKPLVGILYLCTFGLCGIGWILDTLRYLFKGQFKIKKKEEVHGGNIKTLSSDEALPEVMNANIILHDNEVCHYSNFVERVEVKNRVIGHTAGHSSVSVRIAKGVTYRTGGAKGESIRGNVAEKTNGILTVTNKRIVFASTNKSFDKKITDVSTLIPCVDGMQIQVGNNTYSFLTNEGTYICDIIKRVLEEQA